MQTYRNASNKHPRCLFTFGSQRGGGGLIRGGAYLKGALIQNPPKILNQIPFFLKINYLKWSKTDLKTFFKQQIGFFEVFTHGRVLLVIFLRFLRV